MSLPAGRITHGTRVRLLAALLVAVASLGMCEVVSRVYWWKVHAVPLLQPDKVLLAVYPELSRLDSVRPSRGDGTFDVLLLGGSVLDPEFGSVEEQLQKALGEGGSRPLRIFNLARPGHMTRDSRLKYAALTNHTFDLVLLYHGINDVRANVANPTQFQEDYSHMPWYRVANMLARQWQSAGMVLPVTLRYLAHRMQHPELGEPPDTPSSQEVVAGSEVRTAATFETNIRAIVAIASARSDPLVLMTYAIHVPADYTLERFERGALDYGGRGTPIEIWGEPRYVTDVVFQHNLAVRNVARESGLPLVDQDSLLPRGRAVFDDVCHLTTRGSEMFVQNIVATVRLARAGSGFAHAVPAPTVGDEGQGSEEANRTDFRFRFSSFLRANRLPAPAAKSVSSKEASANAMRSWPRTLG